MKPTISIEIKKTMQKAFWELIHVDFMSTPPKYDHFITLVGEIRDRIIRIRPRYQETINNVLDPSYLKQRLEHEVADIEYIMVLITFICDQIKECCAPADDELVIEWKEKTFTKLQSVDIKTFIPDFFAWFVDTTHTWIDHIEEGIREFIKKIENTNNKK